VFGSTQANAAIAWAPNGTQLWKWAANGDMQAVEYLNGNLYFGFHDGFQNNHSYRIIGADALSGRLEGFAPVTNGLKGVEGIATDGTKLVAVGDFHTIGGVKNWGVALFG